jgi:hypothetical protein
MTPFSMATFAPSERTQDLAHERDVAQLRRAPDDARLVRQERGRHQRQNGVLRAADRDFAMQGNATFDEQTFHG